MTGWKNTLVTSSTSTRWYLDHRKGGKQRGIAQSEKETKAKDSLVVLVGVWTRKQPARCELKHIHLEHLLHLNAHLEKYSLTPGGPEQKFSFSLAGGDVDWKQPGYLFLGEERAALWGCPPWGGYATNRNYGLCQYTKDHMDVECTQSRRSSEIMTTLLFIWL